MADCQNPPLSFYTSLKSYHAGRADEATIVTVKEVQVSDAAPEAARVQTGYIGNTSNREHG